MKLLYAIQGTGNGHITRSLSIIKALQKRAEVDVLISGIHNEIKSTINVHYNYRGLGFIFGQQGGIDYKKTFKQNSFKTIFKEIKQLPVEKYDLVISDFEPISAWAAKRAGVPTIGISNQVSGYHKKIKKPFTSISLSRFVMQHYAKCDYNIGLHFESVDKDIETPIIREEIRIGKKSDEGFGLVYLPFYSDEIIYNTLIKNLEISWIVFSKHSKIAYKKGNIQFEPINSDLFTSKLLASHLVISAAGFGTASEALHLGKKLIVIPMKGQFEQLFNAYTLKNMGVTVLKSLFAANTQNLIASIIHSNSAVIKKYPNNVNSICDKIFELYNGPISQSIVLKGIEKKSILNDFINPLNLNRDSESLSF